MNFPSTQAQGFGENQNPSLGSMTEEPIDTSEIFLAQIWARTVYSHSN